jgi:hypothetical protein
MYGSASTPGLEAYNLQLSKERGEDLVEYLKEHYGVKADIEIYPLGEMLAEPNSNDDPTLRTAWLEIVKNESVAVDQSAHPKSRDIEDEIERKLAKDAQIAKVQISA